MQFDMTQVKPDPQWSNMEVIPQERELILFNDDVNTFDFVINVLMDVCGHDLCQAEQCALTAHFNGKCCVKKGDFDALKDKHNTMVNKGLVVEIK